MTGIYGIYNQVNGKWYVGQAVDIERRKQQELSFLRAGKFHGSNRNNEHMTRAWEIYGHEAFIWVVLEECSVENLDDREIFWIAEKDSYKNGYNQTTGGGGRRGYHLSGETKKKISDALKGRPLAEETRRKMSESRKGRVVSERCKAATRERVSVAVIQTDANGASRVWESATAAAKALGLHQSNITKCCRGKLAHTGGSSWRYA